jgi:hypothetical protein
MVLAATCLRFLSYRLPLLTERLVMAIANGYERLTPDEIVQLLNRQTYEFSNEQLKGMLINAFRRIADLERGMQRLRARELMSVVPVRTLGPRLMK